MNICFTSDKSGIKKAAQKSIEGFFEVFAPPPKNIDVLVLDGGSDITAFFDCNIDTCIFDGSNALKVLELKNVKSAVSCGMQRLDSVTFSSISEDSAVVCIRRPILFCEKIVYPCEFKTSFIGSMGIYRNLVLALLSYLAQAEGDEDEEI